MQKLLETNVQLEMGKPIFEWKKIPLKEELDYKNITLNIDGREFTKMDFALM